MRSATVAASFVALSIAIGAPPARAAPPASDRFVAGGTVTEVAPVAGDLIAAGGSVDVDTDVAGGVVAAGGKVRIGGSVGQSVHAAGGQLSLVGGGGGPPPPPPGGRGGGAQGAIAGPPGGAGGRGGGRGAGGPGGRGGAGGPAGGGPPGRGGGGPPPPRLAGGEIEIGPKAHIAGNLGAAAGRIAVRGAVDGHLSAGAGNLLIDAPIGGDVEAAAGTLELGPNARIGGTLRYRSTEPLKRDPAAQVAGEIVRIGPDPAQWSSEARQVRRGAGLFWTTGLMLLAALLVAVTPRLSASVSESLRGRPGFSLVLGFVVLVCTPIATVLLLVTIIGVPLALLVLFAWLALLPVAWASTGVAVGDWFLARAASARGERTRWRVVAAVLGVLLLALASRVPWFGGWIGFAALIVGLGAWALQLRRLAAR